MNKVSEAPKLSVFANEQQTNSAERLVYNAEIAVSKPPTDALTNIRARKIVFEPIDERPSAARTKLLLRNDSDYPLSWHLRSEAGSRISVG
ncbi:hypothetical protein AB6A40_011501 [Gnathostoma spinigerum]|uniref:Pili assembly chaperone N-terminal domain-containing protein n=1 Tax=Gnathostoma spinigerum TaxID=75299 RepID=A0ABD6F010_9BILA